MGSEWAVEAERQAKAITRDLVEVGRSKGYRVTYQKREARFALRAGTATVYFVAHDYNSDKGMDWLRLRIDVLSRAKTIADRGGGEGPASQRGPEPGAGPRPK